MTKASEHDLPVLQGFESKRAGISPRVAAKLLDCFVERSQSSFAAFALPAGSSVSLRLRKHDNCRKAFGITPDGFRQSSVRLLQTVAAVFAAAVQRKNHRIGLGTTEFARHIDNLAIFRAFKRQRTVQKTGFDLLRRHCHRASSQRRDYEHDSDKK